MARELAWLEQKTNTFENPAEKRLEELRRICILNSINNPIVGEDLYDPKKEDKTRAKMPFRNKIRKQADNPDIYLNYKRDRRETMGECLMKGEDYEKSKKEKQETFLLEMKYLVWGLESLNKKELKSLIKEGIIKRKKYVIEYLHSLGIDSEEEDDRAQFMEEPSTPELKQEEVLVE